MSRNFGIPPRVISNTGPLYVPPPTPFERWRANRRADWRTVKMIARQIAHGPSLETWFFLGVVIVAAAIGGYAL